MNTNNNDYVIVKGRKYYAIGGTEGIDPKLRKQVEAYLKKNNPYNWDADDLIKFGRSSVANEVFNPNTGNAERFDNIDDETAFKVAQYKLGLSDDIMPTYYGRDERGRKTINDDAKRSAFYDLKVDISNPNKFKIFGSNDNIQSKEDIRNLLIRQGNDPRQKSQAYFNAVINATNKQNDLIKPYANITDNEGAYAYYNDPVWGTIPFVSRNGKYVPDLFDNVDNQGALVYEKGTPIEYNGQIVQGYYPKYGTNGLPEYNSTFKQVMDSFNSNVEPSKEDYTIKNGRPIIRTQNTTEYDEQGNVQKEQKKYAVGGTTGEQIPIGEQPDYNMVGAGGSHEQNPQGGVPYGMNQDGSQNMVEQGEVSVGNNVFSDRTAMSPELCQQLGLPEGTSPAQAMQQIEQLYEQGQIGDQEFQEIQQIIFEDQEAQKQGAMPQEGISPEMMGMPQQQPMPMQNEGISPEMMQGGAMAFGGRRRC